MSEPSREAPVRSETADVTIHDVAREARVSIATVSRVLNGTNPVKGATSERVMAAVERLGYIPHSGARSLIKRETRTLGVLLPDMFGEFFSELIRGLDLVARRRGFALLVTCTHGEASAAETMLRTMHGKVDGMVILSSDLDLDAGLCRLLGRTPTVFLNQPDGPQAASYDAISVDNHGGALSMTRYLLGLGHRRIAFIGGPEHNMDARQRLEGWREAMASLAAEPDPALEVPGDFSEASGYRAACRLLKLPTRPTAIFAANDDMALGALAALRDQGVKVPEDISLAGFDDVPIVRYLSPALTSVRAPIPELGARAAERLLNIIEAGGASQARQETLDVVLVTRASTCPPRLTP
ncbi:LacI family DNA-binding transcriptional regulator [Mesoterricola sediminis]|uniref:LacI family transcriptional regulator n=1 Tax=Mesoterricola sediminis TaxID=2927980 RepID=A0AA48H4Z2_9BACT|nr:LacI family DNA-binding transcriptional regulator [Mesoterricola sediminis]BDU76048.1 LacI family transcriptional regulator [Mesoterricola sediminis]